MRGQVLVLWVAACAGAAGGLHVRPPYPLPPYAGPPPARVPLPEGPSLTAADFQSITAWIEPAQQKHVDQLQELIDATDPDDAEMPMLLHRLAVVHARRDDAAAAIAVYRALVDDTRYRAYPQLDEALFELGRLLGTDDDAVRIYERLLKDFPASSFVPHAYAGIGDHQYATGALDQAEPFYAKAASFTAAPIAGYARYMRGWVALRRDDLDGAAAIFTALAVDGDPPLAAAARLDLVRVRARAPTVDAALAALDGADATEQLMRFYGDAGRHQDVLVVAAALTAGDPEHPERCAWHAEAAFAALALDDRARAADELAALAASPIAPRCDQPARALLGHTAWAWHRDGADPAAALALYDHYLRAFPDLPDRAVAHRAAAELAWSRAAAAADPALWHDAATRLDAAGDDRAAAQARDNAARVARGS
jgi:hypothetical protein